MKKFLSLILSAVAFGANAAKVCHSPSGQGLPPGAVIAFASNTAPAGFLLCDGASVDRDQYPDLFAAIGTTYGPGSGADTFNLPDMRDAFIRGAGGTNGAAVGTKQPDAVIQHQHSWQGPDTWSINGAGGITWTSGSSVAFIDNVLEISDVSGTAKVSQDETRPINYSMYYYIKY